MDSLGDHPLSDTIRETEKISMAPAPGDGACPPHARRLGGSPAAYARAGRLREYGESNGQGGGIGMFLWEGVERERERERGQSENHAIA
jgi:hypothetical protein